MPKKYQQFFKFIIVSGLNTAVDFGVYGILITFFEFWSDKLSAAHAVALVITTIHAYLWNSYWVFPGSHQSNISAFVKYVIVSLSGMVINVFLFWICIEVGLNDWLSKVGLMGFLFLWNFVGNKWWVYTDSNKFSTLKSYGQTSNLR